MDGKLTGAWTADRWQGLIPTALDRMSTNLSLPATRDLFVYTGPDRSWPSWTPFLLPAVAQTGDSCLIEALCVFYEAMIRRFVDPDAFAGGWQLNAWPTYKRARAMFYPHAGINGGLMLGQGLPAAVDTGLFPPDSVMSIGGDTWELVADRLEETPLIGGTLVHDGMHPDRVHPASGCIDHSGYPSRNAGGHAWAIVGVAVIDGCKYRLVYTQWGEDVGVYGIYLFREDEWQECAMGSQVLGVKLPEGWEQYDGWKRHLVKRG